MNRVVFSTGRDEWSTPQAFFDAVNSEFSFTIDACATKENAKCDRFLSKLDNGLNFAWSGVVWLNPPYGYSIGKWVEKAFQEAKIGATVVGLIPAKTEAIWWHEFVMKAHEIRLIKGRMRFSGSNVNAPFPSALVIWKPGYSAFPVFSVMDRILDPGQSL